MSTRKRLETLEGKQRLTQRILGDVSDALEFLLQIERQQNERIDYAQRERGKLRAKVEELSVGIEALPNPNADDALRYAIEERRVVTFKYRDRDGETSWRVVSPYELEEKIGHTVRSLEPHVERFLSLQGYDHGREGLRHFRVERIEGAVTVTNVAEYREPQDG
jgi:predicted DNA-binding transcriptional regulator YafY